MTFVYIGNDEGQRITK